MGQDYSKNPNIKLTEQDLLGPEYEEAKNQKLRINKRPKSKPREIKVKRRVIKPKDAPKGTMTAAEAWLEAKYRTVVQVGDNWHEFSYVGWQSPSTGQKSGPYLISVLGDQAVEITPDGLFKDAFSFWCGLLLSMDKFRAAGWINDHI